MSLDIYLGIGKPEEKKEILVESYESKVVFEPNAAGCGGDKKLYSFDESLKALRKRGYERHPRPAEVFDLICRSLEGRLQPEQQAVVDDMLNSHGEWLSLAMKKEGDKLHCYFDPENIKWDGRGYLADKDFKCSLEKVYDIQSLSGWVSIKELNKVSPELVEILWSRPYAILPEEIRKDGYSPFPPNGKMWPVGRYYYNNWYYLVSSCYDRASRGVRLK